MSQYISKEYYTTTFRGSVIPNEEIEKYLFLASEKIDELTFNRIVAIGFDNLTTFQKEKIENAICYQAEYIYENGIEIDDVASYGVMDISVSLDSKKSKSRQNNASTIAYDLLSKTGLMCRSFVFDVRGGKYGK